MKSHLYKIGGKIPQTVKQGNRTGGSEKVTVAMRLE